MKEPKRNAGPFSGFIIDYIRKKEQKEEEKQREAEGPRAVIYEPGVNDENGDRKPADQDGYQEPGQTDEDRKPPETNPEENDRGVAIIGGDKDTPKVIEGGENKIIVETPKDNPADDKTDKTEKGGEHLPPITPVQIEIRTGSDFNRD